MAVPEVLVSGNHEEIRRWRRQRALEKTLRNRPDLLEGAALSDEDKKLLARIAEGDRKRARVSQQHQDFRIQKDKIMSNLIIEKLLAKTKRTDLPEFAPGRHRPRTREDQGRRQGTSAGI